MSDARPERRRLAESLSEPGDPISLDDAIARIETGKASPGVQVDLGEGRIARADGADGLAGLLQRLKGHRMLTALAAGGEGLRALGPAPQPAVAPEIKPLLDAVRQAR
ncbi:MAG: hypothetical protein AAFX03_00515 [Pseudomonadota bacterium]